MPIDFDNITNVCAYIKCVAEIPKNVSKKELYSVKYTNNEGEEFLFHNVAARAVHYKKKYNKTIHYLYVTDAS